MFPGSLVQIVAVVAFVALAIMVLKVLLAPGGKRPQARDGDAVDSRGRRRFARALDHVLDEADAPEQAAPAPSDEARFQATADQRLRPLLDAVVLQAAEHGRHAAYVRELNGGAETWRLEVDRPELAEDQPRPYIAFSRGGGGRDVAVIYGGVFPAPADHNGAETEIGWRDVHWRDVDRELLRFAERTFHRPDPGASSVQARR